MEEKIIKYPRTPHLEGSRLAPGDEDLSQIRFTEALGRHIAIEEKVDGANTAISFSREGELLLQSRGHFLRGGAREGQFNLFKSFAHSNVDMLYYILGERYIMYGEWMYAKHGIYYDRLPHYFMEFDIFDKETGTFLDTGRRKALIGDADIVSAPTLAEGVFKRQEDILAYLSTSRFISEEHLENLKRECISLGIDPEAELMSVPHDTKMEGIYIKVEEGGIVTHRMKYVRRDFRQIQLMEFTDSHYKPLIKNKLSPEAAGIFF